MFMSSFSKSVIAVLFCATLAGCKSDAERADAYFQSGLELLEAGDVDRAMVEFRNVFEFEQNHLETRMTMGNLFLEQGKNGAAYGQFLRVAEQFPEEFDARIILSELAFLARDWEEFERHGAVSVTMQPDNPRVQVVDLGMKYRAAVLDEDTPALEALYAPAQVLLTELPENQILNALLIDANVRDGKFSDALERFDALIAQEPDNRQYYMQRLALLAQMQDREAVEMRLREMVELFPEDQEAQRMLFRYYISEQRLDDAEAFLRELSDPADEDPSAYMSLIRFIGQVRGEEAARVEIERAVAVNPNPNRFKAMLAMLDFQAGERDKAIADLEAILTDADPALEETQFIKTTLARMFVSTGNQVGARREVEEVLAQNAANVSALKMQAIWQLQADEVDEAIANLRVALDNAPEDVQVMNLLYDAYLRLGDPDVAREYLALAVDASGNSPETSLRYARLLIEEERYLPAEDVLLPALRQAPENVNLLGLLGQLYLRMEDSARATQVIDTLNRLDTDQSRALANQLQVAALNQQGGTDEAIAYLESLANQEDAGVRDQLALANARLQTGQTEEALKITQELVAENPENLRLKQALASTQEANGDLSDAEASLREILAEVPQADRTWLQLSRVVRRQGQVDAANAVIDEAIEATDRNPNVMWAKASLLERDGDVDAAIAIYEEIYAQNSGSIIVANNLASLLATYKNDEESLERAWVVGRRLKDVDSPAVQDTYGWLLFRRGQVAEAVPYLENAAAALEDPIVQAHLGFAYASLERNEEALAQMQKAVDLAGPADTRERIEEARAEISRLRSLPEN